MKGRSTNQVDMSILPGVEEYPLRLMRRDVKDSAIANNHRVDEFLVLSVGMVALTTYGCGVPREKLIACNSINDGLNTGTLDKVKSHQPLSPRIILTLTG
jgi:hypothetical protein